MKRFLKDTVAEKSKAQNSLFKGCFSFVQLKVQKHLLFSTVSVIMFATDIVRLIGIVI